MRVFLSYASEDRLAAERIYLALIAERHQVFFDRTGTEAGEEYHRRIRDEIYRCQRLVFLISPPAVSRGRYTLTELSFAQDRWPHPAHNVLPVMVAPTDLKLLPNYLKVVTILEPQGDVAAEVAATLRQKTLWPVVGRRWAVGLTALLLALASGVGALMWHFGEAWRRLVIIRSEEIAEVRGSQWPGNFGYRYEGAGVHLSATDGVGNASHISRLRLLEDKKPLGPPHAGHADIQSIGKGRYSHWNDGTLTYLYFSTSDNSDPRKNGREYSVVISDKP